MERYSKYLTSLVVFALALIMTAFSSRTSPVSGTVTINNATVAYGTSSGTATDIIVTVNETSQTYASCAALEDAGGMCVYN